MQYFCEAALSNKLYFFISELKPKNKEIRAFAFEADNFIFQELEKSISVFNSKTSAFNILHIYMMLSELCLDEKAKSYFDKKASELANNYLKPIT